MLRKLVQLPFLLIFAAAIAGIYGVVHNQISYTVAPAYFHEFKFDQFSISGELRNRVGAGVVGFMASWFMGLIIGIPIGLISLFAPDQQIMRRLFLRTSVFVVFITLLVGLLALIHGYFAIGPDRLPFWMAGREISTPAAFARAGYMHNFSYLGGLIGLLVGVVYSICAIRKSRKRTIDPRLNS